MKNLFYITRRELGGYFSTPVAYVFLFIFLLLAGVLTFLLGGLYENGQADLRSFFFWHPWLYLFLVPALSMRLWAEERRSGTIELLLTLPVTLWQVVVGKFLAAWAFTGVALLLTFPVWFTVNYLGEPDNGTILASYAGSFFMAGGFLAIGAFTSALTKNQVIAFVLGIVTCFLFVLFSIPPVVEFMGKAVPAGVLSTITSFSFPTHFQSIQMGVIDIRDAVFFLSVIVFFLFANALALDVKKAK